MNKKSIKMFEPGIRLLFVALLVLLLPSFYYNKILFAAQLLVLLVVYSYYARATRERQRDVSKYIEDLSYDIDSLSQQSVLNFPLPMVLVRCTGEISWYNQRFSEMLGKESQNYFGSHITSIFADADLEKMLKRGLENQYRVTYEDRNFVMNGTPVQADEAGNFTLIAFYLIEETQLTRARQEVEDHQSIVGVIMIDNYDEVILQANDVEKANIVANIDKRVGEWAQKYCALVQRFQRDRYILLAELPYYKKMVKERYSILDSIKEITVGESHIPVTLSIGIGKDTYSFVQKFEYARAGIEIALGRGGDQVVVKSQELYEYFGGKSKEMEKRTKVKSRVMATALKELIKGSDNVYIMGHRYVDLDALGAAVGISRIARNFGKNPKVFVDARTTTTQRVIDTLEQNYEYEDTFQPVTANLPIVTPKTLLIVVDTHSSRIVEWEALLKACTKVVVIDHHRRGEYFIDSATLMFHEPYASSTCEMVTEVAGYLDREGRFTREEANALLAGIILDTKGFTLKTGVRTFEAASALKRQGADPVEAKKFFQNSLDEYKQKVAFISTAEFFEGMAICVSENESGLLTRELFAQSLDDLMSVEGVDASFGIARFGDQVHVSGRSYGKINVQVIMERMGGGGHQTMAATQIRGKSISQVKAMLINAIYYQENIEDIREDVTTEQDR